MDEWDLPLEDSPPTAGGAEVERFKWAWNEERGALVWTVSGPGDGRPFHEERVREEWGREPKTSLGDVLGEAAHAPARRNDPEILSVRVYFGSCLPAAIRSWFEGAFPNASVARRRRV